MFTLFVHKSLSDNHLTTIKSYTINNIAARGPHVGYVTKPVILPYAQEHGLLICIKTNGKTPGSLPLGPRSHECDN